MRESNFKTSPRLRRTLATLLCILAFIHPAGAQSLVTFDNTSDLTTYFTEGLPATLPMTNRSDLGLGNSACINVQANSFDIWTTKAGYSVSGAGDVYVLSAYFKNRGSGGYGALGFSTTVDNTINNYGAPLKGLGMSFHGGGGYFENNRVQTAVSWAGGDMTTGTNSTWYKMILTVTAKGSNTYDLNFQIWNSDTNGVLSTKKDEKNLNGVVNADIGAASILHVYFAAAGDRMEKIDNFSINLSGGATIIDAGKPVVVTNAVSSITANTASCGGNVTDEQGAAVSAKGVCWSTTAGPTIADSKSTDGTGTGSFTSSIAGLTPATTYYVRAYATNSNGTSYGSEVSFTTMANATVKYVTPTGSGTGDGSSWANALSAVNFPTSLAAAVSGDQYWVAAGTYNPTTGTDRSKTFTLPSGVQLYGGFTGTETQLNQRNFKLNNTILSGDIGTQGLNTDNSYIVVTITNASNTTRLDGFTITGAYNTNSTYGGGVLNTITASNSSSPTITNCIITQNSNTHSPTSFGGGIANYITSGTSNPVVTNCFFSQNSTGYWGGAVEFAPSSSTAPPQNSTGYWGGAVDEEGANSTYYNCVFVNNFAVDYGGAFRVGVGSTTTMANCSFYNNYITSSSGDGGGLRIANGVSNINAVNLLFANNSFNTTNSTAAGSDISNGSTGTVSITYSLTQNYTGSTNIVNSNPVFVNTANLIGADNTWGTSDDGLMLQSSSPAKGAGTSVGAPATDIVGTTRPTPPSMGAYESSAANAPTVTTQAVTAITQTTATGNGNITDLGTVNPTAYGVCWNTTGAPTITDSKVDKGAASATGAFTAAMTGLTANTTYHVRAYATNSVNTSYGDEVTFTTLVTAPSALSYSPNPVDVTVSSGNVSSTPTVTGTVDSYSINPALPTGVTLNSTTGVISGIPTVTSAQTVYTVTATNGGGSTTASFTLTVNAVVITTSSTTGNAVIGSNGAVIDPTIVISGVPTTDVYSSASVYINAGFKSSEDKITYPVTKYGVTGSYNAATGVLTLTGSATVAQYQEIFRTIMYQDTNPAASSGSRSFTFELGAAKGIRTLNLSPAAPTANAAQSVCVSGTVADLVATAPAGSSVRWYDAATAGTLLTSSTALVNLKTYYAESWDGTNASVTRTAVVLTINVIPVKPVLVPTSTAKVKVKLCPGDNIVCSNFDNTLSYQWKLNGSNLTGQTSNQYKVPVGGAGAYSLYVKNLTTGCDNLSATVTVDLYNTTTPVIYEKKKSDYISILIVDNTSKFYTNYSWSYADGSALPSGIVTDRQFLVLPPANMAATYMVNITDTNACKVSSAMKTVALHTIAAKAYPTLNNGNFMVGLTDAQDGKLNVKIFNQNGILQKVYAFDNVSSEFEYQVNSAGLQAGAYTVEISLGDYVQSQKIIIR